MKWMVFPCLAWLAAVAFAAERPYEFDWANRTADEFPPVARLEGARAGW